MKKYLFALLAIVLIEGSVQAENAVLKHENELKIYYTTNALKNALNDAVAGEVITLSSGYFNIDKINKAVTIIGSGMETDVYNGIEATVLTNGSSSILIDQSNEEYMLVFESICFNSPTSFPTAYTAKVYGLKANGCKFNGKFNTQSNSYCVNSQFVNCVFLYYKWEGNQSNDFYGTNSFINCYIYDLGKGGANSFLNCVIRHGTDSNSSYDESSFLNCIFIAGYDNSSYIRNTNHCIATTNSFYPVAGASNYTNEQIFKTFRGTYTEGERFELTDEGKQILGMDGTEIGMQGGYVPYDPTPTNIQIERCTVDKQTDENGKLNVSIKLREKKTETEQTEPEEQTGE